MTLGQDFCGEALALGADVAGVRAGDEIYGFANGTYAEYAVTTPDLFATKPTTIDDVLAAALPTPGLTALQLVRDAIDAKAGDTILIHGAAGGVGSVATQLCLAKGVRVIATASAQDVAYLYSLGVAQVFDYKVERFDATLRGLDAVIDLVGGDAFARSIGVLRDGGMLATTVSSVDAANGKPVRAVRIVMRKNALDLEELARLVDAGTIKPRAPRVMPLDAAREAQDLSQTGRVAKKVVLALDGT
jgi:NADPH:quinone reductase-like Zn-dependent oxidoreductase